MPERLSKAELSCSGKGSPLVRLVSGVGNPSRLTTLPSSGTRGAGAARGLAARDWKLLLDGSLAALIPPECPSQVSATTYDVLGSTWGWSPLPSSYGAVPICFTTGTGWFNPLFRQEKGFLQTSAHLNRVFSCFPTHICTLVFLEGICMMRE